ncbi:MAG: HlyD family efflux transporter periplasmic adaptor subunit [Proteocatella sp.]
MDKTITGNLVKRILILLVLGTLVYGGYRFYDSRDSGQLVGVVETTIYANISELSGRIDEIRVEPGMSLKKGDVIAVIDDTDLKFSLTQAEANLTKLQEALVGISGNADKNAVKSAISAVKISEAGYENTKLTHEKAKDDYEKNKSLFDAGGTSEAALDGYKLVLDQSSNALTIAQSQIESTKAALNAVVNGAGSDKIIAAKASIVAAQSQIDQIKDKICKRTIKAVCDGTVISRNYVLGDFVSPGFDIADIASSGESYVKIYYPAERINELTFGQNMNIMSGEETFAGKVSFIDLESQYTPTDMQSSANRNKDSVVVKLKFEDNAKLKIGETVSVLANLK